MDGLWAILQSGLLNLAYVVLGILIYRALILYANRSGATGKSFTLHTWLDAIADSDAAGNVGPKADRVAMALVIGAVLLAGAVVIAAFVRG